MKRVFLALILLVTYVCSFAQIKLPSLISNGMVLQRDELIKIWGWAAPSEKITIEFIGKKYQAVANNKGEWAVNVAPQEAGGPHQMVLTASNKIVLTNILFGDVWLCSGQSNMELAMNRLIDKYPKEIANAKNDKIRQFLVPDEYDFNAQRSDFTNTGWTQVDSNTIFNFSGVAYFFAKEMYAKHKVPIGIINAALGGSPAQAWISEKGLKKFPNYFEEMQRFKSRDLIDSLQKAETAKSNQWYNFLHQNDLGLKNAWKINDKIDDWGEIILPASFNSLNMGSLNGVVWLKREFYLKSKPTVEQAKLLLGTLRDADSTFVNGHFVGNTTYFYPPRRYLFATDLLKESKNVITVRLVVNNGSAEFVRDKPYQLITGKDTTNIDGKWSYKWGVQSTAAPSSTFFRWKSGGLYNAMIAPLKNYRIKGAIWYQGESNTGNPKEYGSLMRTLMADWQETFAKPQLPFLIVQLPNFMETNAQPMESSWAEMREQQRQLTKLPHTALITTIDLGEWNDIHPLNKKDVGKRLALQARKTVYKENIVGAGPIFKSLKREGNKLVMIFTETGKGLVAKNGSLKYFAIAGNDNKFVWADAKIVSANTVVISNTKVAHPVKVRYAWADNPEGANLYNSEGLAASPFEVEIR
ncbi:MAG: sialate O-acetylesterase [Pedobacter sp.]|uniref:sialate O-acetylesterase n=1 Tax=Pedobacter sp. TaxID=1411316 RepID=UPI002809AB20|nr:sialate O-acetylesterase [Pedobacter sp.]MDQ8006139.1 sialate O-acetylesterase [Pedobacter sp.]